MELLEVKIVQVGNREFPVKITARAMIDYEKLSGKSITNFENTENLIQFFYVTAKAGARSEGIEFKYNYEEFLDVIDDYYAEVITNFSKAISTPGGGGKKSKEKG